MTERPALRALADRLGIVPEYHSIDGSLHVASDATREALIAAMGFDGSSEASAEVGLARLAAEPAAALPDAPGSCLRVEERLGARRLRGTCAFVATLPTARSQGAGDFTDLAELAAHEAARGAHFIGMSPLHAVRHRGDEVSPYSPLSRLFRDEIYLDVEAAIQSTRCEAASALLASAGLQGEFARLRQTEHVLTADVIHAKRPLLQAMSRETMSEQAPLDPLLLSFATFRALDEHLRASMGISDWHDWPMELRDPSSEAVRLFARKHESEVALHVFVQRELDRQLAEASRRAKASGMELGLYQDLALGSAGSGFDTWAFPDLFAEGVSVGAPPDPLGPEGQDWGFPPLDPRALEASGFEYFARVLRASLAHSGALRIDHVLGLVRQFWIPRGRPASEGAYVRQPTESLLRVLARESRAAGALIVGEDLGTIPEELPALLDRFGILSTRVLLFEREGDGSFRAAASYPERALVTATTHDLPPLAGWWEGSDLRLRRDLGLIASDGVLDEALCARWRERELLTQRLRDSGLSVDEASPSSVRDAVHAFLAQAPSRLVGTWLDDELLETRPLNVPGLGQARHRSWTRRLKKSGTVPESRPVE